LLAILCGCATLWLAASGWAKAAPTVTYNSCNGFEEEGMPVASIVMGEELGRWGPGRSGGLILSGEASPFRWFGYSLTAGNASYVRLVAPLQEEGQRVERRLVGHRLEYRPCPWLVVAVSETAVGSGDLSAIMYWPFPGFPLYGLQKAAYQADSKQDSLINVQLGADFRVSVGRAELWGEFLIDDAQATLEEKAKVPDMIAYLVGAGVSGLGPEGKLSVRGEYVRIANFVYSHRNPDSAYILDGKPLGHSLGPDADMFELAAEYALGPGGPTIEAAASVQRHGEGELAKPWAEHKPPPGKFPSGEVELVFTASLGVRMDI